MDRFTLSFVHAGKQYELESKLVKMGYIHQFHVHYESRTLIFEFDEERQYRVMEANPATGYNNIDKDLLAAMAEAISSLH